MTWRSAPDGLTSSVEISTDWRVSPTADRLLRSVACARVMAALSPIVPRIERSDLGEPNALSRMRGCGRQVSQQEVSRETSPAQTGDQRQPLH